MLKAYKHRLCFMDYKNDFPHSTSARLTLLMSTFFNFSYAEIRKLKFELCVSDTSHNSIILSLVIVESFDLVASDFILWNFL